MGLNNLSVSCFCFNDTATTEIYTLSLHDALPISDYGRDPSGITLVMVSKTFPAEAIEPVLAAGQRVFGENYVQERSEEHTSELQSRQYLVCRLLLEKKKRRSAVTASTTSSLSALR